MPAEEYIPLLMNLELTTKCPLSCPQCYCSLNTGRDMAPETARYWLEQGASNGVKEVCLSGGETLCYPQLLEIIAFAQAKGISTNAAFSGAYFTAEILQKLREAGLQEIYISLNGPTQEINAHSRDGFSLAIDALALLQKEKFPRVAINWVMHNTNADTLPQMVQLAEQYEVGALVIMAFKPDSHHALPSLPTAQQMQQAAAFCKGYHGPVQLVVENCYSPMRALLGRCFFGNLNNGLQKGCTAGRDSFSVGVDGRLSPCRHLELFEQYNTLAEYWQSSSVLQQLRCADETPQEPCSRCTLVKHCRPCMAVNSKINHRIYMGDAFCLLQNEQI